MKSAHFLSPRTVRSFASAAAIALAGMPLAASAANTGATITTTAPAPTPASASASKIKPLPNAVASYALNSDQSGDNVPATFGAVFVKGDIPSQNSLVAKDASGKSLPIQVDVKARHPDGSLRHAIVTVVAPHLAAGQDFPVGLSAGAAVSGSPLALTDLPSGLDANVNLSMTDGTKLSASLKSVLASAKPEVWLSGPQVTEWWVSGPLRNAQGAADPHLSVRFGIRSYGKDRPLRIEVDVENTWMWVPGPRTEFYDATITANGKTILTQTGMGQMAQTRWRKTFWWSTPADVFVKQDLSYLKKARVVPSYNPKSSITEAALADAYKKFLATDRRPLETGIITHYMPQTGGRGDIGPFPKWTVLYLLTMDKRAYEMTMVSADLSGSYGAHFRNEKTGRPGTTEEFPKISTNANYVGKPGNLEKPDTGGVRYNIVPDPSHEPSLAFIPYLVTGERYYLEELQFWSQWNAWGTAPATHGYEKGLVGWQQPRGQGWSLRTLAQAAYITPDNDPIKATLGREMAANLADYNAKYTNNNNSNVFHGVVQMNKEFSPWQDDFVTWSAGYLAGLGFGDAAPYAKWKGNNPVQRITNPDFCFVIGTAYRMEVQGSDGSLLKSWADARTLTLNRFKKIDVNPATLACGSSEMGKALALPTGKMWSYNDPNGYTANLRPALATAVDFGTAGAQAAWDKYIAQGNPIDPQWDIVPWSMQ